MGPNQPLQGITRECTYMRISNVFAFIIVTAVLLGPSDIPAQTTPGECLSDNEATLADLLNDYREQNGLARVPVTVSLAAVAQWHVWDLSVNSPYSGQCNLHSWSDNGDLWTAVCYTDDHANAGGMWSKPGEITAGVYTGAGYEIAYAGSSNPASALNAWKSSSAHNDVILNAGVWDQFSPWPAMGIGMLGGYAVVWFGDVADPQGTILPCDLTPVRSSTWGAIKALYGDGTR
jgi:hypothetical protein